MPVREVRRWVLPSAIGASALFTACTTPSSPMLDRRRAPVDATFRPEDAPGAIERTESFAWGRYTLKIFHFASSESGEIAQIRDGDRVLREVGAPSILEDREGLFRDWTGDGVPELRLTASSGGAYCCYVEYLFDRTRGVENALMLRSREYHLTKGWVFGNRDFVASNQLLRDLDGDGRPEIVVENDAIQYVNGATHGATTLQVLSWDGRRYLDASKRFPKIARERERAYRRILDKEFGTQYWFFDAAAGYYAEALLAGDRDEARAWIAAHAPVDRVHPKGGADWLAETGPEIEKLLDASAERVSRSFAVRLEAD
jgi:hypothetical protein